MKHSRLLWIGSLACAAFLGAAGCGSVTEAGLDSGTGDDSDGGGAEAIDASADGQCESADQCDDGIACTVGICSAEGECSFEPDDDLCDDQNECTINTCDGEAGCATAEVPDGETCSGGTCQGGVCQGEAAQTAAFRLTSLVLEHPHLVVDANVGTETLCDDVTFNDLVILGTTASEGLNPRLANRIEALDLNLVNILDPFEQDDESEGQTTLIEAECESETSCEPTADGQPHEAAFAVSRSDSCLDDLPPLFDGEWPDGRHSEINSPAAGAHGCYVSEPAPMQIEVELAGDREVLELRDARFAARFGGEPAATIEDGIIVGFMSEEAAADVEFALESDFGSVAVGLDTLLPRDGSFAGCGNRSHCSNIDARAVHDGECGWWFVFQATGVRLDDASAF